MEHTVQGYLKRCTTGKLLAFLELCRSKKQWEQYDYVIEMILRILKERMA